MLAETAWVHPWAAPHRPAAPDQRVASALIAGSEIELALLCAAAQGTLSTRLTARTATDNRGK